MLLASHLLRPYVLTVCLLPLGVHADYGLSLLSEMMAGFKERGGNGLKKLQQKPCQPLYNNCCNLREICSWYCLANLAA